MEVPLTEGLNIVEVSRFTTVGYIQPGWMLMKPLSGIVEQDQEGHYYFISNEGLGLYAVGFTQEEALADFKSSLIDNYQLLEARVKAEPDLELLFQEYQAYLSGERLRKGINNAGPNPAGPAEGPNRGSHPVDPHPAPFLQAPEQISSQAPPGKKAGAVMVQLRQTEREPLKSLDPFSLDELALLLSLLAEYRTKALPNQADLEELGQLEHKLKHLMGEAAEWDKPG